MGNLPYGTVGGGEIKSDQRPIRKIMKTCAQHSAEHITDAWYPGTGFICLHEQIRILEMVRETRTGKKEGFNPSFTQRASDGVNTGWSARGRSRARDAFPWEEAESATAARVSPRNHWLSAYAIADVVMSTLPSRPPWTSSN